MSGAALCLIAHALREVVAAAMDRMSILRRDPANRVRKFGEPQKKIIARGKSPASARNYSG
jgi:hypothetical protein